MGANDADEGGAEETPIVVVDADPASRNLAEDLEDEATIPGPRLDVSAWPGFWEVFSGLVGALPEEYA